MNPNVTRPQLTEEEIISRCPVAQRQHWREWAAGFYGVEDIEVLIKRGNPNVEVPKDGRL